MESDREMVNNFDSDEEIFQEEIEEKMLEYNQLLDQILYFCDEVTYMWDEVTHRWDEVT